MIPFGSQRGLGQDLAIHLLNEHDNELMEIAEIRGAVADDLPGAFAEWEAQAHAMTKAQKYLYSLSVNPDARLGGLTRAQYDDYIARVEERLGLTGQPRAIVFHIKNDREHAHVVWSRVDANHCRAIPIAFDKHKLMMVTREFARDHGIKLPDGYERYAAREQSKNKQLSLYEAQKRRETGLSREGHMAAVTEAWSQSDSADAFVAALQDKGYQLATGKRPYVLVDTYGHTHALPRLIDDKSVRTKDIRAFLGDPEARDLPSVEDAQAQAKAHLAQIEQHQMHAQKAEQREKLDRQQKDRRDQASAKLEALKADQERERGATLRDQARERGDARSAYLEEMRAIRAERTAKTPKGLASFLGKVTGVDLIRKKIHRHQDRQRMDAFQAEKQVRLERQEAAQRQQEHAQRIQLVEQERRMRSLAQLEARERASLETAVLRDQRVQYRRQNGVEHMPTPKPALELKPPGRPAAPAKAKARYTSASAKERYTPKVKTRDAERKPATSEKLREEFRRAGQADGKGEKEEARGRGYTVGAQRPIPTHPVELRTSETDDVSESQRLREAFTHAARSTSDGSEGAGHSNKPSGPSPRRGR